RSPNGIAVNGQAIYFVNDGGGTVMRMPLTGGTPTAIASAQQGPTSIALDSTYAYWTNHDDGTLMYAPLLGNGGPIPLVSGQTNITGIALDANYVYFTTHQSTNGMVKKVAKPPPPYPPPPTTTWQALWPESGWTNAIAVDPQNPNVLYIGGQGGL